MSCLLYLASDKALPERPNPHERMLSVREAITAGVKDIPDFLLTGEVDLDKPGVILVSDREVRFDAENGTITDGDFDDDAETDDADFEYDAIMSGLDPDELMDMDEDERDEALEDAGLDPDDYDF